MGFPGGSVVKNPPAQQEAWIWSLGLEEPLEKETATHSSIVAWTIPWTEEPGGLQSMGWQRVGRDLATEDVYTVPYTMSKTTQIMPFNLHNNCIIRYFITSVSQIRKLGHRELNLLNVGHLISDKPAFTIKWPHSFIPEPGLLTTG